MAIPLALPILFSIGSIAANTIGARRQDRAIADAMAAERMRQSEFDDQSFAINREAQQKYKDVEGQQSETQGQLADYFKEVSQEAPAVPQPQQPQSSQNVITDRRDAAMDTAKSFTDDRADQLANFRSMGDLLGGLGRDNARSFGELGTIDSFRRGSQGVLPLELQAAQERGGGMRMLGDLFSLGSSLTMTPALTGQSLFSGGSLADLFRNQAGRNAAGMAAGPMPRPRVF